MEKVVLRYRARDITINDITQIKSVIEEHYNKGRSYISRILCQQWNWIQANGNLKEYAARDLLLRLEEKGFLELPPRLRSKNNLKQTSFDQAPIFNNNPLKGSVGQYHDLEIRPVDRSENYLWSYLLHHNHYLGAPKLVGEHLKYIAYLDGKVVACLAWASAAFKVKDRDEYIGWNPSTRKQRLNLVVNNSRFLILPWIEIKHLASKVLAYNLKRLRHDWQNAYNHPICLAETFVDISQFQGTCYKAANWIHVGQTKGSSKRGNDYQFHGQAKAVYLYSLDKHFRRQLCDDQR